MEKKLEWCVMSILALFMGTHNNIYGDNQISSRMRLLPTVAVLSSAVVIGSALGYRSLKKNVPSLFAWELETTNPRNWYMSLLRWIDPNVASKVVNSPESSTLARAGCITQLCPVNQSAEYSKAACACLAHKLAGQNLGSKIEGHFQDIPSILFDGIAGYYARFKELDVECLINYFPTEESQDRKKLLDRIKEKNNKQLNALVQDPLPSNIKPVSVKQSPPWCPPSNIAECLYGSNFDAEVEKCIANNCTCIAFPEILKKFEESPYYTQRFMQACFDRGLDIRYEKRVKEIFTAIWKNNKGQLLLNILDKDFVHYRPKFKKLLPVTQVSEFLETISESDRQSAYEKLFLVYGVIDIPLVCKGLTPFSCKQTKKLKKSLQKIFIGNRASTKRVLPVRVLFTHITTQMRYQRMLAVVEQLADPSFSHTKILGIMKPKVRPITNKIRLSHCSNIRQK